ncbi:MAG: hypothetical protein QHI38_10450 [Armatimonadota bacterium]|nr:hypothetical protein [Armatimonadota bacterium]
MGKVNARTLTRMSAWMMLVLSVLVIATTAGQAPKAIRIIYTNDTLGYLEPCG